MDIIDARRMAAAMTAACLHNAPAGIIEQYCAPLLSACAEFGINTYARLAAFLAQVAHESASFRFVEEIDPGNRYEGRADLGNTQPGDGPRFRGHGLIQITGRGNHQAVATEFGLSLEQLVDWLKSPEGASRSAAWFFARRADGIRLSDAGAFDDLTKRINGGLNGIVDRKQRWEAVKGYLSTLPAQDEQAPAPIEDRTIPPQTRPLETPAVPALEPTKGTFMAPFILPLLEIIAAAVPTVAKLFGSGSEVANRNIAAATVVADAVVKATGAVNLQDAAERVQKDAAAAASAEAAVRELGLFEVGGGVVEARKFAAPEAKSFWQQPALWITLLLLPLVYWVVGAVLHGWGGVWAPEIRASVVSAVISGVLGSVTGFWLGTSWGSSRKTDMLAGAKP